VTWLQGIKDALSHPIQYVKDVHSAEKPDSHIRWVGTAYTAMTGYVLVHSEAHHVALDPTVSSTILGLGGIILGAGTARKIWGEKDTPQHPPNIKNLGL
jgi:hypothetical protein